MMRFAVLLFIPALAYAQGAPNTPSTERAFLGSMISYTKTGSTAPDLVRRAIAFDPDVATATRTASRSEDALESQRAAEALRLARLGTQRAVLIAWAEALGARRRLQVLRNLAADNDRILALVKSTPADQNSDARAELVRELETEQARVRAAAVLAEATFNTTSSRLAALVDASISSPVVVNSTFELTALQALPSDVEALALRAEETRPELRIARIDERIAQAEILRSLAEPQIAMSANGGLHVRGRDDTTRPDPAEARDRRRVLQRRIRSEVEMAWANFMAGQQGRKELEPVLAARRAAYGAGELNTSELVMQQRQRFDLEMELEHVTASLMRAGIDLITSLGMEP